MERRFERSRLIVEGSETVGRWEQDHSLPIDPNHVRHQVVIAAPRRCKPRTALSHQVVLLLDVVPVLEVGVCREDVVVLVRVVADVTVEVLAEAVTVLVAVVWLLVDGFTIVVERPTLIELF